MSGVRPGDRIVVLVCLDCRFEAELERVMIGGLPWPVEPNVRREVHRQHDPSCPSRSGEALTISYMGVADEHGDYVEDWSDWPARSGR